MAACTCNVVANDPQCPAHGKDHPVRRDIRHAGNAPIRFQFAYRFPQEGEREIQAQVIIRNGREVLELRDMYGSIVVWPTAANVIQVTSERF